MKVTDLITQQKLVTIRPDQTLMEAVDLMQENRVGGLPVIDDGGHLVGIVSMGQIMHYIHEGQHETVRIDTEWHSPVNVVCKKRPWECMPVEKAMLRKVVKVPKELDARDAARALLNSGVHRAVVVDGLGRPVGMLSSMDFVRLAALGEHAA